MSWLPKKSIVVPVDFSEASIEAIRVALELCEDPSNVHVVHVTQPVHVSEPGMFLGTLTDIERVGYATEALAKRLEKEGISGVSTEVRLGTAGHEIADLAEEKNADLIVIPSHGRSGVKRFFLGSVTEKVLRMANCQVLVLRVDESKD